MPEWKQGDNEEAPWLTGPATRRSFVGRSAGAFAGVAGAGALLAACGDDEEEPAGGGSAEEPAGDGGGGNDLGQLQVVNILPPQLGYSAEYIAEMDGYFEKEGLEVVVNTSRGSAPAIQAVLSGTALLSWVGWLESVIAIANQGAPIQAIAFTGRRSPLAMVSHKEDPIKTPEDMKGKRVGIPSEGGTSETTVELMMAKAGLTDRDVQRQVTGFTPGTFALIERGRIAGFIIGGSQQEQFRVAQPDSTFMETGDFVTDGLTYITSKEGLEQNREGIEAYLRALKGAMEQILDDAPQFNDTIEKLRSKYDFAELEEDNVARSYLKFNTDNWVADGRENLLKVDKELWQKTYDDAVEVDAAKPGVDVTQNVVEGLI